MEFPEIKHDNPSNYYEQIEYVNPTPWFVEPNGTPKVGLYGGDYIHLSEAGYTVWAKELKRLIVI
ncbi:MAG: hypothetical protein KBE85_09105 [Bacteroides sp.]|nr:hypothetical protein [Bacteroides sp.]